jgi:predicted Rossmann fold nucleotide-binding protein DprA/Smf involved in DNA uptake
LTALSSEPAQATQATIDRARALIESRLEQLELERARLREALGHLGPRPARRPARRARSKRAGRGQRQAQFLELVAAKPGAPVAELAREMGVRPQQLYAIARRLTESGAIAKRDGGYVAVEPRRAESGSSDTKA